MESTQQEIRCTREDTARRAGKGADFGDAGGSLDPAYSVEARPDSGGSFLRKRDVCDRGGYDGGGYRSGNEPGVYCGELGKSDFEKILVRGGNRGSGPDPSGCPGDIQGYDVDEEVIRTARKNAANAGVDHLIHFQQRAVKDLRHPKPYGFIITNPPYGERLEEKETLPQIYREFGESFRRLKDWSAYMITSYEDAERWFGRKADKNRKIYNGMIKTYFYQFMGPKPPRRKKEGQDPVR